MTSPNAVLGKLNNHVLNSGHGYTYNTDNGLRKWRAALAKSTIMREIVVIGDSITAGYYATEPRAANGFVGRMRTRLQTKYGDGGWGCVPLSGVGADRWTLVGTWTAQGEWGPWGCCKSASGNANTATIADLYGDVIELYVVGQPGAGQPLVSVDGGADTPVVVPTATTSHVKVNVPAALGTHSVTIKAPESGPFYLWGAGAKVGTTGLRIHNISASGLAVPDLTYSHKDEFIDAIAPQLTIIPMTTNDFGTQTTLANYKTQLIALVTRAKLTGDVLLVASCASDQAGKAIPQTAYAEKMFEVANEYGCAYVDIYNRWGGYAAALANGFMHDHSHPKDAGHEDQATALIRAIIEVTL
jgi:lysophospholipase L1-like esterase